MKKTLDTNVLPEKQKPQIHEKQIDKNSPRLGTCRAGIKHKKPQPVVHTTISASKSQKIPMVQNVTKDIMAFPVPKQLITNETETITTKQILSINTYQTFHPYSIYRPFPRPLEDLQPNSPRNKPDTKPKIDVEFEENSPHQEGIISESYQRPNKSYFQKPKDLESSVNTSRLVKIFLPKQADIDKILKIIQQKGLKGMHLSVMMKEIQEGYLNSSYFKDRYLYLAQNKLPSSKVAIKKVEVSGKIDIVRFIIVEDSIYSR